MKIGSEKKWRKKNQIWIINSVFWWIKENEKKIERIEREKEKGKIF